MKTYKGVVKGNTVVLDEKPDLPAECPALVEIKPLDQATRDEEITRHQLELLKRPHKGGKLLYRRREELYDCW
ncbi:MAG: hypothetical protein AB1555_01170 [Nitrospirota bacterium]